MLVAQTHDVEPVQLGLRHSPLLQIMLLGQSLLKLQLLPHCAIGVAVGVGVGVAVAQTQLLLLVQLGLRHSPLLQIIVDGQSEFVRHELPH